MKKSFFEGCPLWFKPKGYPHFDLRIRSTAAARRWSAYIQDPERVKRHSFFPFIKNELVFYRRKPDENGEHKKRRPIMYASHVDANIYAYYGMLLSERYEALMRDRASSPSVLAYRRFGPRINNVSFSKDAFDEVRNRGTCVALAFDVKGFFDTLDHQILREQWCQVLDVARLPEDHYQVFRSLTRFSYVERKPLCETLAIDRCAERTLPRYCEPVVFREEVRKQANLIKQNRASFGIPQGSPMSALLSNIYMLESDERLFRYAASIGASYRRYCDDILIICEPDHMEQAKAYVSAELLSLGLTLNEKKTEVAIFVRAADGHQYLAHGCKPLQYLGFEFDGANIRIRSQSLARYYRKMKSGVKAAAQAAKNKPDAAMPRTQLYTNYTHLGRRNFVSYAFSSSATMASGAIRQQVGRHWKKLDAAVRQRQPVTSSVANLADTP